MIQIAEQHTHGPHIRAQTWMETLLCFERECCVWFWCCFFALTNCRLKELWSPDNEKKNNKQQQQPNYKSSSPIIRLKIVVSFISLSYVIDGRMLMEFAYDATLRWFTSYWILAILFSLLSSLMRCARA